MPTRSFRMPDPIDSRRTVAALGMKASGKPSASAAEAWWATRTPDGPATLHVELAAPEVNAEAWGPGAGWVLDWAPSIVGAHDRPGDFEPPPGLVRDLHRRGRGLRIGKTGRVFEAVLPAILGQKVTNREARLAGHRLARKYGEPAPGRTDLWLAPDAATLAGLSYWDLHPLGIERKRARTLAEAAHRANRLEEIMDMDRDDAVTRLTAVRGIGPWTAGHVMGIAWGDPRCRSGG